METSIFLCYEIRVHRVPLLAESQPLSISQMYIDFSRRLFVSLRSVLLALVFANQHAPNSLSIICQFRIPKPGDNGICFVSFNISDASRQTESWDLGWGATRRLWSCPAAVINKDFRRPFNSFKIVVSVSFGPGLGSAQHPFQLKCQTYLYFAAPL